jgi:hypothetical protein
VKGSGIAGRAHVVKAEIKPPGASATETPMNIVRMKSNTDQKTRAESLPLFILA